jgi:hypothetical protein
MIRNLFVLGAMSVLAQGALANDGAFETPKNRTAISGKSLFSGWVCEAETIEIEFESGARIEAAYGAPRADVVGAGFCDGNENVGFGVLHNMALLGTGTHTVDLLVDGEVFKTSTFDVVQLSPGQTVSNEDLEGATTTTTISDFPTAGHTVTLSWEKTLQNFVITEEVIPSTGTGEVLDNGVVAAQWNNGLGAFDEAIGYATCVEDGGEACPSLSWATVDDEDRGTVLEVTYADADAGVAAIFFEAAPPVDMSDFAGGMVHFDVKVIDAGNNTTGWIMKQDCVYPCTSGDQAIGTAGLSGWESVSVPVSQLVEAGLDLTKTSTGLVIWPDPAGNEGFIYRIDNVYWGR